MASKKGRRVERWIDTSFGCLAKNISHLATREAIAKKLVGEAKAKFVLDKFNKLLPYHQEYWQAERSDDSITGRGMTSNQSKLHRDDEDPIHNKHTKPYLPLATEIYVSGHPYHAGQKILEELLNAIALGVSKTSGKKPLPLRKNKKHKPTIAVHRYTKIAISIKAAGWDMAGIDRKEWIINQLKNPEPLNKIQAIQSAKRFWDAVYFHYNVWRTKLGLPLYHWED